MKEPLEDLFWRNLKIETVHGFLNWEALFLLFDDNKRNERRFSAASHLSDVTYGL
jgi:hypothetical protein